MGGKNSFFRKPFGTGKGSVAQMTGMETPELETPELSAADKKRASNLTDELEKDIAGESDSMAIQQYERAQQDNLKNAMALGQSTKGVSNPALLSRNVAEASKNQGQELAQASATARMQERQSALDAMNRYLAAQQGVALQNAQMQNQADQATMNRQSSFLGNAGMAAASYFSDENMKKNIKKSDSEATNKVDEFLNALESYTYEYKDEKNGKGEKSGVMAQDLEKSELGKQMVEDTKDGKMVDVSQGFSAMLASISELNKEIQEMKKKKKG